MMAGSSAAAVIAIKPIEYAKSRLAVPDPLRRRLAWTMALDTLSALCRALPHVLVVSDQPALEARLRRAGLVVDVISESGHVGINSALTRGALRLHAQGFTSILACVGDLPALRSESAHGSLMPRDLIRDLLLPTHQALEPPCWWHMMSNWRRSSKAGRRQPTTLPVQ
jgi:2-phospho-L-lactate guanylyltransferase (CobY/MobA/RfbA family)